jgi:hypothetical protein
MLPGCNIPPLKTLRLQATAGHRFPLLTACILSVVTIDAVACRKPIPVGDGRTARRHPAVMPPADPPPEGGGFAATWLAFSSSPTFDFGGRSGKKLKLWPRVRGVSHRSPSAPGGGTGRVKEKGISVVRRSRWSLQESKGRPPTGGTARRTRSVASTRTEAGSSRSEVSTRGAKRSRRGN